MSRDVATCSENEGPFDAVRMMRQRGVRRLPVPNANGGLAGIVTTGDIYAALSTQTGESGNALSREQVREMEIRH